MSTRTIVIVTCACLLWGNAIGVSWADERYYLLMFGSQTNPNLARLTHTYALFVKASGEGQFPQDYQLETHHISWMPHSLVIETLRPTPVPGVNLNIKASIRWAQSVGARTTMWGPFRIRKELFDMAVKQAKRLNSGGMDYICIDSRFRGRGASNCCHAVSDIDSTQTPLDTGVARGEEASLMVLRHFKKYILPPGESLRWLADRLDIKPSEVRFASPDVPVLKD